MHSGWCACPAATATQRAIEEYKGHGVFTYAVAEALGGKADGDADGYVRPTGLANYVDDEVPELTKKALGREQYPTVPTSGEAFPVVRVR
jgi:uncharacterized caspase-like protein